MSAPTFDKPTVRAAVRCTAGLPGPIPWCDVNGIDLHYLDRHDPVGAAAESMSVVVATWNSNATLPACLSAVARAAAVVADECAVEIIVVDDGSESAAADHLADLPLGEGQVLTVPHGGQARASNAGAAVAQGDILVFVDSDMVITPWTLREVRRALARWPEALGFGFRENVDAGDGRLAVTGPVVPPELQRAFWIDDDNRFEFDTPGLPMNLFAATHQLADLRRFQRIRPPGRSAWWLARMAYGCLLACSRTRYVELGGADGRFVRWGFNDTELATRWMADGGVLVPVFTASGLHARHPPRNVHQWRDAGLSRRLYEQSLDEPAVRPMVAAPVLASRPLVPSPRAPTPEVDLRDCPTAVGAAALTGDLGAWQAAVGISATDTVADPRLAAAAMRVLRLSGSLEYLDVDPDALGVAGDGAAGANEQAWLALALGDGDRARRHLRVAAAHPGRTEGGAARYVLGSPPERLLRLAAEHGARGIDRAAAGGLLAAGLAGGRYRAEAEARLAALNDSDRRIF